MQRAAVLTALFGHALTSAHAAKAEEERLAREAEAKALQARQEAERLAAEKREQEAKQKRETEARAAEEAAAKGEHLVCNHIDSSRQQQVPWSFR